MSFTDKYSSKQGGKGDFLAGIIREKARVMELFYPFEEGMAWYILQVDAASQRELEEALQSSGPLALSDYGSVLHCGWGEDGPSEQLRRSLRDKYGLYEE